MALTNISQNKLRSVHTTCTHEAELFEAQKIQIFLKVPHDLRLPTYALHKYTDYSSINILHRTTYINNY